MASIKASRDWSPVLRALLAAVTTTILPLVITTILNPTQPPSSNGS